MVVRLETCGRGTRNAQSDGTKYGFQFCACWSFAFGARCFKQAIFTESGICHFGGFLRVAADFWIRLRRPVLSRLFVIYSPGAAYGDYLSGFDGRPLLRPSFRSPWSI